MRYLRELAQRFIKSRKAQVLVAIAIIFVIGIYGAPAIIKIYGNAGVEDVVREMNFRPASPPQSPEYPGTLYLVNSFGELKSVVCKSKSKPQPDKAETRTIYTIGKTSGKVGPDGKLGDGESQVAVSISFKDSKILKHDDANLNQIATELQKQESCRIALENTLGQGRCVVQSQSILISTVELIANESGKVIVGPIRNKLLQNINIRGELKGIKRLVGEELQYGLRLRDRCMIGREIEYPRFVPDKQWWIVKFSWNFMLSVWERISRYIA